MRIFPEPAINIDDYKEDQTQDSRKNCGRPRIFGSVRRMLDRGARSDLQMTEESHDGNKSRARIEESSDFEPWLC